MKLTRAKLVTALGADALAAAERAEHEARIARLNRMLTDNQVYERIKRARAKRARRNAARRDALVLK
jgi:hypothetical protein